MKVFESARIVSSQYDPSDYHAFQVTEGAERGDRSFTQSRSELFECARCPARYIAGYQAPETDAMEYGKVSDCLVLDYGRFKSKFVTCPDTYRNDKGEDKPWTFNAKVCKEWRENQIGKTIIKSEQHRSGLIARITLLECEPVADLLKHSDKQVFILGVYRDKATGIELNVKALIDIVPHGTSKRWSEVVADFKTCRSANPERWPREVFTFGYHVQGALYLDLFNEATGEQRTSFLHVLQENYPPYHVLTPLPMLSQEFIEIGRMQYLNALQLYCQCLNTGLWPSYPSSQLVIGDFQVIEPIPWMMMAGYRHVPSEVRSAAIDTDDDIVP